MRFKMFSAREAAWALLVRLQAVIVVTYATKFGRTDISDAHRISILFRIDSHCSAASSNDPLSILWTLAHAFMTIE